MVFKKMTLVFSIMLALNACSSTSKNNPANHSSSTEQFINTPTSNTNLNHHSSNTNTKNITPLTVNVKDVATISRADILDEIGHEYRNQVNEAQYSLKVGNQSYTDTEKDVIDLSKHFAKNQVSDVNTTQTLKGSSEGKSYYITENQKWRAYRQDYSVVAGFQATSGSTNLDGIDMGASDMFLSSIKGQATTEDKLPKVGIYNYSGQAFTQNETNGKLSYDVDFTNRTGKGEITNIHEAGKITLHEGTIRRDSHINQHLDNSTISGMAISSSATSEKRGHGTYTLGFFGPNAEEIAGIVEQNDTGLVGFGGKRGNEPKSQ